MVHVAKLPALHAKLIAVMNRALDGEPLLDSEGQLVLHNGEIVMLPPKSGILKECREMLKDNGIDSEAPDGSPLASLAASLPIFEDDLPMIAETVEKVG